MLYKIGRFNIFSWTWVGHKTLRTLRHLPDPMLPVLISFWKHQNISCTSGLSHSQGLSAGHPGNPIAGHPGNPLCSMPDIPREGWVSRSQPGMKRSGSGSPVAISYQGARGSLWSGQPGEPDRLLKGYWEIKILGTRWGTRTSGKNLRKLCRLQKTRQVS